MTKQLLTYSDHSRHFNQCIYVYPVVSRRAQGVSLGLNLNINNACNWRCVYCQVEGLVRGKPEAIDLAQLEYELDGMLEWILHGDFMQQYVPANLQRLNDICLSGNGESTLSPNFNEVCQIIAKLRTKYQLTDQVKTVLISNGSEILRPEVQHGLAIIAGQNGELWFKIDRATATGINVVNQVQLNIAGIKQRLQVAAAICPTYIQSCWFAVDKQMPATAEVSAFIDLMQELKPFIRGVLLYSTARNPALAEGRNISQVTPEFLEGLTHQLRERGLTVSSHL